MRVYLPATLPALAARLPLDPASSRVASGLATVCDAGAIGYAVTPRLREWYREGGIEELEYAALTRAAAASLRLLARAAGVAEAGRDRDARRVVVAADVADGSARPAPDIDAAAVRLVEPLPFEAVAAVHVDEVAAAEEVARAARVVDAAAAGDDDARFLIDGLDDHELQWYAAQEIGFLLG